MKKRLLSLALCLTLCLGLLPPTVWATEDTAATIGDTEPEAPDEAVLSVQALIDALPEAAELDSLDSDALDTAYADTQTAYDAYETLTEAQQAQITGANCFESLFGWFNEQVAPLADATIHPDKVDANGDIIEDTNFSRTGPIYEGSNGDADFSDNKFYVIQDNVTIPGNLTIGGGGGLVLCQGATLTVEGALIHSGGSGFYIYGQSNSGKNAGRLVVKNSLDNGAAIRSESQSAPQLHISSGELEIYGGDSGKLVDNVALCSTKPIHHATLDGKAVLPAVWSGVSSIAGTELILEYCTHENTTYTSISATQHKEICSDCGFEWPAEEHNTNDVAYSEFDNTHHKLKCSTCGAVSSTATAAHELTTAPTDDGKRHTTRCKYCGYTSGTPEDHTYDENGKCTVCDFKPVAKDDKDNLYDSLQTAFETVKDGDTITLTADIRPSENITFGEYLDGETGEWVKPDYSVTLVMDGHTLYSTSGDPALTVSGGTLTIKDAATIMANDASGVSAIKVEDGNLTFKDAVNATGGDGNSNAAPAIEVSGGKVTFEGAVNATGGLQGVSGNAMTCKPAVYATGGEIDFQGDLNLNGGLTITGDATLTNKLSKGTFRVEYYTDDTHTKKETVTGPRVSVEGSKNYNYVRDLLADNRIFINLDSTDVNNKYFASNYESLGWNVTIEAHEHNFVAEDGYTCVCGLTCDHSKGYQDGKCEVCGKPCPHGNVDSLQNGAFCRDCGQKMLVQNTKGDRSDLSTFEFAYFANLKDAMAAAEDGWTVKLLDDVNNDRNYATVTGNKTITLNLNGKAITNGWIYVGRDQNGNILPASTLKITGSGSFETTGNLTIAPGSTLDLSEWTGSKISTLSLSKNGDDEATLTVGENAGTIGDLAFNWPSEHITKTKLQGGTYGLIRITVSNYRVDGIPFSDLLDKGYAFQYTESGEFLNYATKAEYAAGGLKTISNVKVVKCTTHVDANSDKHCDYCNTDLTSGMAATLTVGGKTYYYTDLPSALTKATDNGGTVQLLQDVTGVTETLNINHTNPFAITLDLNGHTISGAGNQGSSLLSISVYDDVTICDTSSEKNGKIECTKPGNYAVYVSAGTLTITGGTYKATDIAGIGGFSDQPGCALGVGQGTFVTIHVGKFSSSVNNYGNLTISGGTFASLFNSNGNVGSLLAPGYAFADSSTNALQNGYTTSTLNNVTIVPHTHVWTKSETQSSCVCGLTCDHAGKWKDGVCSTCGYVCQHISITEDNKCETCNVQIVAQIGDTYYKTFREALNAVPKDNSATTIKLLDNVNTGNGNSILPSQNVILDMNGKSITRRTDTGSITAISVGGKLSLKNGGSIYEIDVTGELDLTDWTMGSIPNYLRVNNKAKLKISENQVGQIGQLVLKDVSGTGNILVAGGKYGMITGSYGINLKPSLFLAPGYAVYRLTTGYIGYETICQGNEILNAEVRLCTAHVDENKDGYCDYCNTPASAFVASVTKGDAVTYYSTLENALTAASSGDTVTLLKDVDVLTINKTGVKLDANGKTIRKLTVSDGATLSGLLPEGYAYKNGEKWISELSGDALENVTTARIPILSMGYERTAEMDYGGSGSLNVTLGILNGSGYSSIQWYRSINNEFAPMEGEENFLLDLSKQNLSAGKHTFRFAATCDGYTQMSEDIVVTVHKIDIPKEDITVPEARTNLIYNTEDLPLVTDGATTGGTMLYRLGETGEFNTAVPKAKNAGQYTVWYMVEGDDNHNDTEPASINVTIGKATPDYTLPTGLAAAYGQTLTDVTLPECWSWADSTQSVGSVGTNSFQATYTPNDIANYNTVTDIEVSVTVKPASYQAEVSMSGYTYGETPATPSVNYNPENGTVTYYYNTTNTNSGGKVWTADTQLDAGTYYLYAEIGATANYQAVTTAAVPFVVSPKSIVGAAVAVEGSLSYNTNTQSPTVTVSLGDKVLAVNTEYTLAGNSGTDAGGYTLTVTGQGNYSGSVEKTWSILPKEVSSPTIEVTPGSVYDGTAKEPAVTVKDGDTVIDPSEYTVSYDNNINAGNEAAVIIADKAGGNYTVNGSTTFPIAKAQATCTPPTANDLTYNGTPQQLFSSGSTQDGTLVYSVNRYGGYVEYGSFQGTSAKSFTIWYKVLGDSNHENSEVGSIDVTIKPAPLTVTAKDRSAYVGSTVPTLPTELVENTDYTITGLFGEEKLDTTFTLSYAAEPDMSKVGEAVINISGAEKAGNYTITYVPGKLTITTRPSSGGSGSTGTKTDTVKNPDGSTTKTETKADGSKTETTTATTPGGSTGSTVTKTDANGNSKTEAEAKISDKDVKDAQEKGEAVNVPVKDIEAGKDSNSATKIKIDLPKNAGKTTVEIPVDNVTSGTVAVIVHPDGTEEIAKSSKPTKDGVQLKIDGSTTVKIIDNSKDFIDTRDHWSRDEVNFVAARELFNGVGNNLFGVSQPMTRGMVNTVLARLSGVDTTPGQGQTWYAVGTEWAKKNGISDGTNPTGNVTREQLATLLYRYAGSPDVSGTLSFADANSVSDYAKNALLWANQNGIVNGVGSNTIAPKANAERAQVAAMFARYLKQGN